MAQLGELQEHYDEFQDLNAEVIIVFREEADGVDGLAQSQQRSGAEFPLLLDPQAAATGAYSQGGFHVYVIDADGVLQAVFPGTKETRPTAAILLEELQAIEAVGDDP